MAVKKKGGRVTARPCPARTNHYRKQMPHNFGSRQRVAPRTNDTTVIADIEHGPPGPWVSTCSWCGKQK